MKPVDYLFSALTIQRGSVFGFFFNNAYGLFLQPVQLYTCDNNANIMMDPIRDMTGCHHYYHLRFVQCTDYGTKPGKNSR